MAGLAEFPTFDTTLTHKYRDAFVEESSYEPKNYIVNMIKEYLWEAFWLIDIIDEMRQNGKTINVHNSSEKPPKKASPKNSTRKSPRRSPKKAQKTEQVQKKVVPVQYEIMDNKTDLNERNDGLNVSL